MACAKIRPWADLDAFTRAVVQARLQTPDPQEAFEILCRRPQWRAASKSEYWRVLSRRETRHWIAELSGATQEMAAGFDGRLAEAARAKLLELITECEDPRVSQAACAAVLVHDRWSAEQRRKKREARQLQRRLERAEAAVAALDPSRTPR